MYVLFFSGYRVNHTVVIGSLKYSSKLAAILQLKGKHIFKPNLCTKKKHKKDENETYFSINIHLALH